MTDQPRAADPDTTGAAPGGSAPAGAAGERIVIRDNRKINLAGNPAGEAGAGDVTGATETGTDAANGGKPVVKDPNPDPEPSAVDAEPVVATGEVDDTESTAAAAAVDDAKSADSGPEVADSVTTDGGAEPATDAEAVTEPTEATSEPADGATTEPADGATTEPTEATSEPATSAIDDAEVAEALEPSGTEGPVVDAPAEPVSPGATLAEEQPTALGAELEALRAELDERTRDLQRVTAEYANYRKRVERDRGRVAKETTGAVLTALLPVLDDLDRAREHGDLVGPFGAVAEQLITTLTKLGLTPFGEKGDPFDPNRHEAVAHQTSAEVTKPTCVDVMRRGYQFGDKVLRAALVAVADPE
ncbi:nucleotide exchange factor GrpE [Micromonospora sp. HM5-17]|uniref:nucleotide exchange factor GrpE n=1 Tax=Micromonospora sp. HM5-17 TaxID=2487710 RepID=UPI000F49DA73|nr:nucleotide exchange factor GrpE [Micromonospora sp. HM5-17]ROT33737.1 nucleotide exchange factor GrpE [Micromonospora sp. HM5-17]